MPRRLAIDVHDDLLAVPLRSATRSDCTPLIPIIFTNVEPVSRFLRIFFSREADESIRAILRLDFTTVCNFVVIL